MRIFVSLGLRLALGLSFAVFYAPATAGTLADYTAKPAKFRLENGVKVLRMQPIKSPAYQSQMGAQHKKTANHHVDHRADHYVEQQAFEHGYDAGFEAGYDKANKKRKTRRSRYNYGRRYSTSGHNPRYRRFRSSISYARPAYVTYRRKKKR